MQWCTGVSRTWWHHCMGVVTGAAMQAWNTQPERAMKHRCSACCYVPPESMRGYFSPIHVKDFTVVFMKDEFRASISTSSLCSSGNAAWWLNGQCSPSSNTKDPLASVQYNNRKDQREKRKGNSKTAMKDSKEGGLACVREPPVVLWPGCTKVEAFPAHCTSEEITSDTLCHSHNYSLCVYR